MARLDILDDAIREWSEASEREAEAGRKYRKELLRILNTEGSIVIKKDK